ncbi:DUF3017 domain-containing protein [Cellulosimicrobium cellulans]|uniref:DUF3017 domain-containing protein n=1 Tax=Cellulosimicrobium cellulans TaxID=1710 RepID=A0A4Y4DWI8_CELCE|nr:DUF3017 domain-containing protein [Cellulosimicrobium cellulans]MDF9875100.1 hypothetical protein [Cellulosimicrobium cellulans]GED09007.1 hypothetical protein CCE02nite_10060 [Cellulosimicrobium cellulans]
MTDVTADGGTRHRPPPTLVPAWHHVEDEPGDEEPSAGAPDDEARPPVPEPPASLAPSRQPAMWLVLAGVAVSTLVAVLVGARAGCLTLAGLLAVAGVCRAAIPGPGPVGITVRSRGLDVFFFLAPAVVMAFLALSLDQGEI